VYPKLECGVPSDRCLLRRSRDEAARHFHRVILFRSVQPRFHQTVAGDNHIPVLGLGGLTFLQLTTTYSPVIAGRNIGHVFFEKNQRYARSERFRLIQVFRVRNRCCWAGRRTPLVGAPNPWCTAGPEFIVGKNSPVCCYTFLTSIIAKVLPLVIPLKYFFLLPQPPSISNQDEEDDGTELLVASCAHPSLWTKAKTPQTDTVVRGLWPCPPVISGGW